MTFTFTPKIQTPELLKEIAIWSENLALLRGDNIYDLARVYFSNKGWDSTQMRLSANVAHGATAEDNVERVLKYLTEEVLEPAGLQMVRTLMGRFVCDDTRILGALVNPTSSSTKTQWDLVGVSELIEFFGTAKKQLEGSEIAFLTRLSLDSQGGLTSSVETIPPVHDLADVALFYPYFDKTPAQMWESFKASKSNILLLIGEPGTGKSNYILQMLKARGWDDKVHLADRDDVLQNPGLADYIRDCSDGSVMVTEDSDRMVMARTEGNPIMSAILNTSSGIIQRDVKLIISTNLKNLNQVDEALTRPGRCFEILKFQKLTAEQGQAVRDMMELPQKALAQQEMTLAEVINCDEVHASRLKRTGIGFN